MVKRNVMQEKTRRVYQKPRIIRVKLEPEEAVLATCKTNTADQGVCAPDPVCIQTAAS